MKAVVKYLSIWALLTLGGFLLTIIILRVASLLIPEYTFKVSDLENYTLHASILMIFSQILPIIVFVKRKYASYSLKFNYHFGDKFSLKKLFLWVAVASVGCFIIEAMNVFNFLIFGEWDKAVLGDEPQIEVSALGSIIGLVSGCIFAPLAEEAIFRGAIERSLLEKNWNHWYAILITAVLFAIPHCTFYQLISPFNIVICWIYYRTRNLWPGILMHVIFNSMALLPQYLEELVSGKSISGEMTSLPFSITVPLTLVGIAILYCSVKQIAVITRTRIPIITTEASPAVGV